MNASSDQFEFKEGALSNGRDLPLSFRWRSDPNAIARLGLPNARDGRYADARNAILTEAVLATETGLCVS